MKSYCLCLVLVLSLVSSLNAKNASTSENMGMFRNLCAGSTFIFKGMQVNGFHQIPQTKGLDIERFNNFLDKHEANLRKDYLVKELDGPIFSLGSLLKSPFFMNPDYTFVLGKEPENYYGMQLVKLESIEKASDHGVISFSVFLPFNNKYYNPRDSNCFESDVLTQFFKNKKNEDMKVKKNRLLGLF